MGKKLYSSNSRNFRNYYLTVVTTIEYSQMNSNKGSKKRERSQIQLNEDAEFESIKKQISIERDAEDERNRICKEEAAADRESLRIATQ